MYTTLIITCARGAVPFLQQELALLGHPSQPAADNAVRLAGTFNDTLRLNLYLRTGHRVLLMLDEFKAENADALYAHLVALPWEQHLFEDGHLTVTSSVNNPTINDSRFATVRCKDAIADRLVKQKGRRPNSGPDRSGAVVHLHWIDDTAQIFLDTSGEPLSKRGYRKIPLRAPMRETLAATCLLAAGYNASVSLANPMCGSGTIAIEAALIAAGIPPGALRKNFGFMHLRDYREADWKKLLSSLPPAAQGTKGGPLVPSSNLPPLLATDISAKAVDAARVNAHAAGVEQFIEFNVCDFRETRVPPPPGIVILNPEYGQRLGDATKLEPVYRGIGDFLKQKCAGYMGYVFTGNLALARKIGLRSKRRIILYNGQLECRLLEFELYHGTRDP